MRVYHHYLLHHAPLLHRRAINLATIRADTASIIYCIELRSRDNISLWIINLYATWHWAALPAGSPFRVCLPAIARHCQAGRIFAGCRLPLAAIIAGPAPGTGSPGLGPPAGGLGRLRARAAGPPGRAAPG